MADITREDVIKAYYEVLEYPGLEESHDYQPGSGLLNCIVDEALCDGGDRDEVISKLCRLADDLYQMVEKLS